MGRDIKKAQSSILTDKERPQHSLYLPDFYIAKTPVTNAQYAAFVQAIGHEQPDDWKPKDKEDHPVEQVSWYDAVAYCKWLSEVTDRTYRLPTEAEWEKAARGTDGRVYPWGNQWDERRCNSGEGGITPVNAYPNGASPYGVLDMIGNVWEWCATKVGKPYPYDVEEDEWSAEYLKELGTVQRAKRGGSDRFFRGSARCSFRHHSFPGFRNYRVGFRLVSPIE